MIKKIFTKKEKGTSLIELIVYFALLSTVLVIAVDIMFRTSEFSLESSAKGGLQEDARFIISRLSYDIHRAENVTTPANIGNTSSTLILTNGSDTYTYNLVGSTLELQSETGPLPIIQNANINSNNTKVNSISFQRLGNSAGKHTFKITFDLEGTTVQKGGPEQKTFETVVGLR